LTAARTRTEQEVYALIERHAAALDHGMATAASAAVEPIQTALAGWQDTAADACVALADLSDPFTVVRINLVPQAAAPHDVTCTGCGGELIRVSPADPLTGLG
jgi:hypothetical protein